MGWYWSLFYTNQILFQIFSKHLSFSDLSNHLNFDHYIDCELIESGLNVFKMNVYGLVSLSHIGKIPAVPYHSCCG